MSKNYKLGGTSNGDRVTLRLMFVSASCITHTGPKVTKRESYHAVRHKCAALVVVVVMLVADVDFMCLHDLPQ